MFGASKTNSASTGGPADPYFYDVTMLLTGNGTNGAQNNTFLDSSNVATTSAAGVLTTAPSTATNGWYVRTGQPTSNPNDPTYTPREYIVRANGVTVYSSTTSFPTSVTYGGITYTVGTYVGSVYGWSGDYADCFGINANSAVFTGNAITRNGNTTQGSFSPYGSLWSNYFDGSSTESIATNTALNFGTGDFTVECWFYRTVTNDSGTVQVMFADGSDAAGLVAALYNNKLYCYFVGTGGIFNSVSPTISNNTWYHFAWTRSGSTMTAYLNGTALGTVSNSGNHSSSTGGTVIGRSAGGTTMNYWQGYISNVRFVKGTSVYSSSFTPSTTPLTAISGTSLLTCQSNRFIDNSSNAFALTVNGTPSVQRFSPFNPTASYDTATIGGSGYFDGTGDYLQSADGSAFALGTGDFTLECWVYPLSLSAGYKYVFNNLSPSGSGNTEWAIAIATATPVFESYNTGYLSSSTNLNLNTWNHIAVSRSGSTLSMFLNGVKTATASNSNNFSASNGARVGAYGNGSSYFTGYVTDARAVKGTAVYSPSSSTITVPTAPLTAITNTSLLCNMTNAGIPDLAMMNDLETVGNAQVSTSVKKFGTGSLAFDGSSYLQTPPMTAMGFGTGDFTIEGWFYWTSNTGSQVLCSSRDYASTANGSFMIRRTNTSSIMCDFYPSGGEVAFYMTADTSSLNTWYHVALVRYNGTTTLYLNGTACSGGGAGISGKVINGLSASGLFIGHDNYNTNMSGNIDDFRISNFARYTANFTPSTTALPTY